MCKEEILNALDSVDPKLKYLLVCYYRQSNDGWTVKRITLEVT